MRLSTTILSFIKYDYFLIVCAFFTGIVLLAAKEKVSNFGRFIEERVAQRKVWQGVMIFCVIMVISWGYLFKIAFYTPYNSGVQGDNFHLLGESMRNLNFYSTRHLLYPWLGGQVVFWAEKINLLDVNSHLFLFNAFKMANFPVKVFSILGLAYTFMLFKLLKFSFFKQILAALLIAVSFGYWLWAIQPNALGIALGLQCIALYYSVKLVVRGNKLDCLLASFFIGLSVYAHISIAYFALGLSIVLVAYFLSGFIKAKRKSYANLIIFLSAMMVMAYVFIVITMRFFDMQSMDIKVFIYNLSDASYFGVFKLLDIKMLLTGGINNAALTLMNIAGIWGPQDLFDYVLIFIMIVIFSALFLYLIVYFKEILKKINSTDLWVILLLTSAIIIIFLGFLLRNNAQHYYVISLIPNIILILFLLFKIDNVMKKDFTSGMLLFLIPTMFLYNGFGSMRVLKGLDFRQAKEFKKFEYLYQKYPNEKVYFFETFDEYAEPYRIINENKIYFFEEPLTTDYAMGAFLNCFSRAFPNINWRYAFNFQDILNSLEQNNGPVIIGPLAYVKIKGQLLQGILVVPFQDKISSLMFFGLRKD